MTQPDEELHLGDYPDPDERDIEAPSADAADQATPVQPEPPPPPIEAERGWRVSEWDAVEQAVEVDLDDEDYR